MAAKPHELNFAFFGTPDFSAVVLEELMNKGYVPSLVVTQPDKPVGRKHELTAPPLKAWAIERGIEVLQPASLRKESDELDLLTNSEWDLFIVAAYGLLFPKTLLERPTHGTLVWHPSLLPKYRGASPMRTQILNDDRECGVTIMQMDEGMDTGPIVAQASVTPDPWPIRADMLEQLLAKEGGALLTEVIPEWIEGTITPEPQDDTKATACRKFTKEDGLIDLSDDGYQNWIKYNALFGWPGVYFFVEKDGVPIRIKITEASFENGKFLPLLVVPEGKKEMVYEVFAKV